MAKKKKNQSGTPALDRIEANDSSEKPSRRPDVSWIFPFIGAAAVGAAYPRLSLWPLAYLGFVPFYLRFWEEKKSRFELLAAYGAGAVYFGLTLRWIAAVRFPASLGYAAVVILFSAIFPFIAVWFRKARAWVPFSAALLFPAAAWTAFEWLLSLWPYSFPWFSLGHSQVNGPAAVSRAASASGVWGVSFLVVMGNVLLAGLVKAKGRAPVACRWAPAIAVCLGLILLGFVPSGVRSLGEVKIAVIQGNFPQIEKDDPTKGDEVIGRHLDLSRKAADSGPVDLLLWSETVVPSGWADYYEPELKRLLEETGAELFFGVDEFVNFRGGDRNDGRNYDNYNGSRFLSSDGGRDGSYRKIQLVPGGEFMPFRRFLEALGMKKLVDAVVYDQDTLPGTESTVFAMKGGQKFGALICFESAYARLARKLVREGAEFLTVITNDAWFKRTDGAPQHVALGRMRAIETGRSVAQSANTGISFIADPSGKVLFQTRLDEEAAPVVTAPRRTGETIYVRWGDWFPAACLFVSLFVMGWAWRNEKRGRRAGSGMC